MTSHCGHTHLKESDKAKHTKQTKHAKQTKQTKQTKRTKQTKLYTYLLPHAHFSLLSLLQLVQNITVHLPSACTRLCLKRYEDEKVHVCFAHVITSRLLPLSLSLMFRPSSSVPPAPSLLFPHGPPDWSAVSDIFSGLSGPEIVGPAHSVKGEDEFGYLAKNLSPTCQEPKQPDQMITADDDATPINDPENDSISDFSKTTNDNTGWFGVTTVCETSASQISRGDLAFQKESEESLTRETEGKQSMRWKEKIL